MVIIYLLASADLSSSLALEGVPKLTHGQDQQSRPDTRKRPDYLLQPATHDKDARDPRVTIPQAGSESAIPSTCFRSGLHDEGYAGILRSRIIRPASLRSCPMTRGQATSTRQVPSRSPKAPCQHRPLSNCVIQPTSNRANPTPHRPDTQTRSSLHDFAKQAPKTEALAQTFSSRMMMVAFLRSLRMIPAEAERPTEPLRGPAGGVR